MVRLWGKQTLLYPKNPEIGRVTGKTSVSATQHTYKQYLELARRTDGDVFAVVAVREADCAARIQPASICVPKEVY